MFIILLILLIILNYNGLASEIIIIIIIKAWHPRFHQRSSASEIDFIGLDCRLIKVFFYRTASAFDFILMCLIVTKIKPEMEKAIRIAQIQKGPKILAPTNSRQNSVNPNPIERNSSSVTFFTHLPSHATKHRLSARMA